jgi:hypothetical protein
MTIGGDQGYSPGFAEDRGASRGDLPWYLVHIREPICTHADGTEENAD